MPTSIGTSFFKVTNFFDIKAKSLNSALFCLISLALDKSSSKLPIDLLSLQF